VYSLRSADEELIHHDRFTFVRVGGPLARFGVRADEKNLIIPPFDFRVSGPWKQGLSSRLDPPHQRCPLGANLVPKIPTAVEFVNEAMRVDTWGRPESLRSWPLAAIQ